MDKNERRRMLRLLRSHELLVAQMEYKIASGQIPDSHTNIASNLRDRL